MYALLSSETLEISSSNKMTNGKENPSLCQFRRENAAILLSLELNRTGVIAPDAFSIFVRLQFPFAVSICVCIRQTELADDDL